MPAELNLASLFAAAADIDDEARRREFVASACGDDSELRRELEGLLAANQRVGAFMESRVADLVATALHDPVGEKSGDLIGPYKLLEQIGEGGMGLVFMAEQSRPLRRRVALKIIRPGLDTRSVIARFEAERQALALMDHPNIARVYDAGATASGRPYFVMELVRGVPITDYCRERKVPLRDRLALFIEVCHAVQHAHQKGIIHRDLKPTNILVSQNDTGPVPKVIDFGVAKATIQPLTDKTLFTQFSQIIGTPLYMSPEQADLGNQDIDTRSDVYSLGVVLYEMLTGMTPFEADRLRSVGHDEMRRIIREEEPPKPSTRATTEAAALSTVAAKMQSSRLIEVSALKGDLDWIVMKTLEKDRRRRYESPSALAADIARHLASEPVEAFPPMRRYRLWKFVRRNQAALVAAGAIATALVVGLGMSIWQAVRASNAERRASQALDTAEARLKIARQAVDDMYLQVAKKWLSREGNLTSLQREFLKKALHLYQGFASENPDDPEAKLDVARAIGYQAEIMRNLGSTADAEAATASAIKQIDALLPILSDPATAELELARLLYTQGFIQYLAHRYPEAVAPYERAVSLMESALARGQRDPDSRLVLASSTQMLGAIHCALDRKTDAERMCRRSCQVCEELLSESPRNPRYLLKMGFATKVLADCLEGTERTLCRRRSLEMFREAVAIDPEEPEFRFVVACEIVDRSANNEVDDYFAADEEAFNLARSLAEEFPSRSDYLHVSVVSQLNFCRSLIEHQRGPEALPIARSALESARRLVQFPGNPDYRYHLASALGLLHKVLTMNGLEQEAETLKSDAIQLVKGDPAFDKRDVAHLLTCLGEVEYGTGDWETAIQLILDSIAVSPESAGKLDWLILALSYAHSGKPETATVWLQKALPLPKPAPNADIDQALYDETIKVFNPAVQRAPSDSSDVRESLQVKP